MIVTCVCLRRRGQGVHKKEIEQFVFDAFNLSSVEQVGGDVA